MQAFRRSAARSAQAAKSYSRQSQRRWAHDAHHDTHSHAAAGPSEEKLGAKFWVGISLLPATFAFFHFRGDGSYEQRYWTRVIDGYHSDWAKKWQELNIIRSQTLEQAGADRNLFVNSASTRHVELKFPETFNSGSPWNVPAGSRANIDHAIAKYEKENYEQNAKKLQQLQDGTIPIEQDFVRNRYKWA
ncbi:hypothetical protein AAFC00_002818 [Neodothiora populina]|uniref:NADH-ubiquinone oxidoreductase 17.8 kDa subunit n=1 Tax=Neodothiora populina TaxID=2781224 RepID=A0ABR3P9M1_9PEZI